MSSHTMAILDLGKAFIILGLDARKIDSKRPVYRMAIVILSLERLYLLGWTYGMPMIFRYDFNWGRQEDVTLL